jgi:hypothetical protein
MEKKRNIIHRFFHPCKLYMISILNERSSGTLKKLIKHHQRDTVLVASMYINGRETKKNY